MSKIRNLLRDRKGATAIEYGLFAGFAALVLMSGLSSIGGAINGVFDKSGQAMAATGAPGITASTPPADHQRRPRISHRVDGEGRLVRVDRDHDPFADNR